MFVQNNNLMTICEVRLSERDQERHPEAEDQAAPDQGARLLCAQHSAHRGRGGWWLPHQV